MEDYPNYAVNQSGLMSLQADTLCKFPGPGPCGVNIWACSWWEDRSSSGRSPPRPGLESVLQCDNVGCLIGFLSSERVDQSGSSVISSPRSCWHTPSTPGQALSCTSTWSEVCALPPLSQSVYDSQKEGNGLWPPPVESFLNRGGLSH